MKTMNEMRSCFESALETPGMIIGVLVQHDDYPQPELITNPYENIEVKIAYYRQTYDSNLQHYFSKKIKIVDFARGLTVQEIQEKLLFSL